jgi:hypothetical protein
VFLYRHPTPQFGARRTVQTRVRADASDARYFVSAYIAGTAFALAYLF